MHSTNHAARFIHELLTNEELRRNVEGTLNSQQGLRDLIIAEGFHFTRDEWQTAVTRLLPPDSDELPEEALDELFGGASSGPTPLPEVSRETFERISHRVQDAF